MDRLTQMRKAGGGVVTSSALDAGFEYRGERIALYNAPKGIWRPRQLAQSGAALTAVTAPRVSGRNPMYDDEVAADNRGWFGYKYQGTDPNLWTNVAMRRAMELQRPMIYLYGLVKGVYDPIFPVYVVADDPQTLTFRLQADLPIEARKPLLEDIASAAPRREYRTISVKRRLHQDRFRLLVLNAYRSRCAMCRLRHENLLDAAHIIPDRDVRGLPEISNGIALCKIHHTAYDENILGISPDFLICVRTDILQEIDGPMLEHGIKGMAGRRLDIPTNEKQIPNRDYLDERFAAFKNFRVSNSSGRTSAFSSR